MIKFTKRNIYIVLIGVLGLGIIWPIYNFYPHRILSVAPYSELLVVAGQDAAKVNGWCMWKTTKKLEREPLDPALLRKVKKTNEMFIKDYCGCYGERLLERMQTVQRQLLSRLRISQKLNRSQQRSLDELRKQMALVGDDCRQQALSIIVSLPVDDPAWRRTSLEQKISADCLAGREEFLRDRQLKDTPEYAKKYQHMCDCIVEGIMNSSSRELQQLADKMINRKKLTTDEHGRLSVQVRAVLAICVHRHF